MNLHSHITALPLGQHWAGGGGGGSSGGGGCTGSTSRCS